MFNTKLVTVLPAMAFSILLSGAAIACDKDYVAVESSGIHNQVEADDTGNNYTSVTQDGEDLEFESKTAGGCNALVTGQYGIANRVHSNIKGRHNGVGVAQEANDAEANVRVRGWRNGVAAYQYRDGSRADLSVHGGMNTVVVTQH